MKKLLILLFCILCFFISSKEAAIPQYKNTASDVSLSDTDVFVWPAPNSRHLTSGFGKRKIALYGTERLHAGVDINTAMGDPVLAIADGTVIVSVYDGGWGEYIMVNHGDNLISLYAHMNTRTVSRGDTVTAGQQIGTSGNSGLSEAPHLHFELRQNGKSINPFQYTFE